MRPFARGYLRGHLLAVLLLLSATCAGAQTSLIPTGGGGPTAPTDGAYLVTALHTDLTAEQVISGRPLTTTSGVVMMDPATIAYVKEDFISGSAGTSVTFGELGWTLTNGNTVVLASEAGRPGLVQRNNSISGQLASMHPRATSTTGVMSPADTFDLMWVFRLNTADSNTTARLGAMNDAAGDPGNDGIYLEKINTDTNWNVVTRAGGVQTRQNLQIAAQNAVWVNLRIRRTDASTIQFDFNDGTTASSATSNTNVPTAQLQPIVHIKAHAAASKTLDLDYFDLLVTGLSR